MVLSRVCERLASERQETLLRRAAVDSIAVSLFVNRETVMLSKLLASVEGR